MLVIHSFIHLCIEYLENISYMPSIMLVYKNEEDVLFIFKLFIVGGNRLE